MEILSILLNRQAPLYLRLSILPAWPPRRHFCLFSVYLRLIQFPVCSDRPSLHQGARKAVMDELRGNSEIEREEKSRSPLPSKRFTSGCKMDEISLCISFSDCFSSRSFCLLCVKGGCSIGWEMWWIRRPRSEQNLQRRWRCGVNLSNAVIRASWYDCGVSSKHLYSTKAERVRVTWLSRCHRYREILASARQWWSVFQVGGQDIWSGDIDSCYWPSI